MGKPTAAQCSVDACRIPSAAAAAAADLFPVTAIQFSMKLIACCLKFWLSKRLWSFYGQVTPVII